MATAPPPAAISHRATEIDERAALLREGIAQMDAGNRQAGLEAWRAALRLDPANLVIRKQLWRADHPERFGEVIDSDWQREQLAQGDVVRTGGSR